MNARTFAIGDIHGELDALDRILARLPTPTASDTLVFLGDYVDRGPDSRGVIERVKQVARESPAKVITLRGNHEDKWIESFRKRDPMFLIPPSNGCAHMYRSFTGGARLARAESLGPDELMRFFEIRSWLPGEVVDWMASLDLWYEDDHAIYVHAGLDGEGTVWKHPRDGQEASLMWMREPDFFAGYHGKRVVFGHTPVTELPLDHLGKVARLFDDPGDVWLRGDLVGIDTGCGKGGFLSAIELPRGKVYESR